MKRNRRILILVLTLITILCLPTAGFAESDEDTVTINGHTYTAAQAAQRALDWQACSNLASAHEDYHTALNHAGELEDLWVNEEPYTSTMSWTNNSQKIVGYDNIYEFYVTDLAADLKSSLSTAISMDDSGTITDSDEWLGTGMLWYHMLMSQEIEVAADGQTAIGHWQSFGTVTGPTGGSYTAQWTCEDYNMVFVKQSNGEWRIWHLRTFVHFYTNVDNHWYEQNMATQGAGGEEVPTGVGVLADSESDENEESAVTQDSEALEGAASDEQRPGEPPEGKGDGAPGEPPEGAPGEPPEGFGNGAPGEPPSGNGSGNQSSSYAEMGNYYTGFDLTTVPIQTGNVKPYETWSDIEDTFLW